MNKIILFISLFGWAHSPASAQSAGGTLLSNTVVCQSANNGLLTLTNYSGTITRWEVATGAGGPWTTMVFTSPVYNYINLGQSTWFRVAVQLPGYAEALSNAVLVSCDAPASGGTVLSHSANCVGLPLTATLTGFTGSIVSWEYSTNGWITTNSVALAASVFSLSGVGGTTCVRARVQSGVCPQAVSGSVSVVPAAASAGGVIAGSQSVCATGNAGTLTVSNHTGTIQSWESSSSSAGPFFMVSNSGSATAMTFSNLVQHTWYRVNVKNENCAAVLSPSFKVNVDQPGTAGFIMGTSSVCAGTNSGTLMLAGNSAVLSQWEYSANNGTSWLSGSGTLTTESFLNLSSSRLYRAKCQNGICPLVYSPQFTVSVSPVPTASFNAAGGCAAAAITFSNLSSGAVSYLWDFGQGGSASVTSPVYVYPVAGTFTVGLKASSSAGCTSVFSKTMTVHPLPVAGYLSADTACHGTGILFSNNSSISSGAISQTIFRFNDGSLPASQNTVLHKFPAHGTYAVYMTAVSSLGCRDSVVKQVEIFPKPNSGFQASPVCKDSPVLFVNNSSIALGPLKHSWNFGNGFSSQQESPAYTYPAAGVYSVMLLSSSSHNCSDTAFAVVRIHPRPQATLNALSGCLGTEISFGAVISPTMNGLLTTIGFGDGKSLQGTSAVHVYLLPGTYVATLVAVTDSGCVSSAAKNITVFPKPHAAFQCSNVCEGDSVTIRNTSNLQGGTATYQWRIDSVAAGTKASPVLYFGNRGNYNVMLVAASQYGCADTATSIVTIYARPDARFDFKSACLGVPIAFVNKTSIGSGQISAYSWDFGDNTSSTIAAPLKEYLNEGTYQVKLIARTSNGCTDTVMQEVNVYEAPLAKFAAENTCFGQLADFRNLSESKTGFLMSMWRFGDDAQSTAFSPKHSFASPGEYLVQLNVTSEKKCSDSVSRYITIYALPDIQVSSDTLLTKGASFSARAAGGMHYSWYPAEGLSDPTIANPLCAPANSSTYTVLGTDVRGCQNSATLSVKVSSEIVLTLYNVITPDGNGLNDTWVVKNIEACADNELRIYDQWSREVYHVKGYKNEWNGSNKDGEMLTDGTYYYSLELNCNQKVYSGYITLMRNRR